MKKTIFAVTSSFIIGASTFAATPVAFATAPISTQQDVANYQKEAAQIAQQIQRYNQAILDNEKTMKETKTAIRSTEEKLSVLNEEYKSIESRLQARQEILNNRALALQSADDLSYVDVVLGATSLMDLIDRVTAITTVVQADKELLTQQKNDERALIEKKEALESEVTALKTKQTEMEGMIVYAREQKAENERLQTELNAKQARTVAQTRDVVEPTTSSTQSLPTDTTNVVLGGGVQTVVNVGKKYIGNSVYVFGGGRTSSDIANGRFDCSAFVSWAFSQAGVKLGASTEILKNQGRTVAVSDMQPGDMVFFDTYKKDGHVGIYLGGGKFIGSQSSTGVAIANMSSGYWADTFNGRVKRVF